MKQLKFKFKNIQSILFFTVALIFLSSFGLIAQQMNERGIETNMLSSTTTSTTIEFVLDNYNTEEIDINGTMYVSYDIPGSIRLMEKGLPQLPTHRKSIIIPDDKAMNYEIIEEEFETIETLPVAPSKGHITRDKDPSKIPYTFDAFYSGNSWYPESNISLDEPYVVRDFRGLTIQFNPMRYNPAEGKLKICNRIVIRIYNDPALPVVNPLIRTKPFVGASKDFNDIYESLFVNYGYGDYNFDILPETGRLLIIYPTAFASNITPFYDWKTQRGLTTLLAEYPTQTGSGAASIKSYIQNLYDSPDGLTFIILVGEANQIPTLYGQYEGAPSDPCYTKLAGNDAYPDAFISRISPSSSDNLDYILTKLIKYEKEPDTGPEAMWYLQGTGVASDQGSPPDYERAEWLRDMLMQDLHFTLVDQIYDPGATSSQVTNALNDGRSILNYIGHGSGTSWGTTGFSVSNIHQLSNGYKNPFIIDVACDNGDFELNECMEEAWVRAGDTLDPKGAIASFGASTLASWVPPCDMQNYAVFLLANREIQTVGGACFNGIIHAMDLWGGSTGEGLKLMEQYNIMGDCTTLLTFGMVPDSTAPDQITDLSATDPTSNSVNLNWTSPYDSSFGGVVSYDLRYSTTPILNENDFENAPSVIVSGEPDTAGMSKSYTLGNLEFSTQYYFAIKAMDIWGNASEMSNVPYETTWAAPEIFVTPDSLYCMLLPDIVYTDSIMLSNVTSVNSTLDYSIEFTNNTFPGQFFAKLTQVSNDVRSSFTKENPDVSKEGSIRGFGGPDNFGYKWIDSNEPDGPEYVWNDISSTGTLVTNWVATASYPPKDEGKAGPFPLGFTFKYYGIDYNEIWFISNGYLSFFDVNDAYWTNASMPSPDLPNGIISPLWDDLDGSSGGEVYYKQEPDKFIVQYTNWPGYYSGTGPFTFQVVLYKNGKIIYYYNTISGSSNSCTVGIENETGTDGLQVVKNANYLESNLAVQFSAAPDWLTADNYSGTIYNGNTVAVILSFLTDGLELGDYSMDMVITSNDPNNPEIVVPIAMTVTNEVPVELASFTAENKVDKVILKWKTATETNNSGFEVERKITSDENSSTGWNKITFVDGRGTTTEVTNYSFEDKIEKPGIYKYRLKQIDFNGTFEYSEVIEIEITGPTEFELYQNYPNPFNPTTTIKFALPVKSKVVISVYNSIGEKVAEPLSGELNEGYHEVLFDATNFPSGVYFYRIVSDKFVSVKKMLLIK